MARIIDKSRDDLLLFKVVKEWLLDLKFEAQYSGKWLRTTYKLSDIKSIEEIDEDEYRSAGGAAAGAIIGGVLTGGVGFLVGAAIGGRRKRTASFAIAFNDGLVVAFHEKGNATVKSLREFMGRDDIAERMKRLQNLPD